MAERVLVASINGVAVGELRADDDLWAFQYDDRWLASPSAYPLSPALALGREPIVDTGSHRPVQWYFDNLLPEDAQRRLLARDAGIANEADAFALLAHYGAESAGSVTLTAPGTPLQTPGSLRVLEPEVLEARIRALPRVALTHDALKRMSLAGAQHKLAVVWRDGQLFEPGGDAPSTHILKPDHQDPDLYGSSVINEWFTMRLAARVGLPVPEVTRIYVPSAVYLVERFDRSRIGDSVVRLHTIDACQLLGIAPVFKYAAASLDNLAELARRCRQTARARTLLFQWLVFNMLVGNTDAHLKNLSFRVSHEGVELAPFYDLLCTAVYESPAYGRDDWPERTRFAWPIGEVSHFEGFDRRLVIDAGRRLGIAPGTSERLLETMLNLIAGTARPMLLDLERGNGELLEARPTLRTNFAGELRCTRAVVHTVIERMILRLA